MSNEPLELFKIHDRTIPTRRERVEREEVRVTREMIRDIARAGSASAAVRETNDGQ